MKGLRIGTSGMGLAAAIMLGCATTSPAGSSGGANDGPFEVISDFVAQLKTATTALLGGASPKDAFSGWPHLIPADRLAEIRGAWTRSKATRLVMSEFEVTVQYCASGQPTARFALDLSNFGGLAIHNITSSAEPASPTVCEGKTNFWSSRAYESAAPTGRWDALGRLTRKLGDALADTTRCRTLPIADQDAVRAIIPSDADGGTLDDVLREKLQTVCASPGTGQAVYVRFDDIKWAAIGPQGKAVGEVKTELNYSPTGLEVELLRWSNLE